MRSKKKTTKKKVARKKVTPPKVKGIPDKWQELIPEAQLLRAGVYKDIPVKDIGLNIGVTLFLEVLYDVDIRQDITEVSPFDDDSRNKQSEAVTSTSATLLSFIGDVLPLSTGGLVEMAKDELESYVEGSNQYTDFFDTCEELLEKMDGLENEDECIELDSDGACTHCGQKVGGDVDFDRNEFERLLF